MISLVCCTYRPGGIDLLAHSVTSTKGDWELVIVDDHSGRVHRGRVPTYLKALGIPLGWYGPSKPKCFPDAKGGLCNAWNTALSHVRGELVVMLSDYTMLPNGWLKQWEIMRPTWSGKNLISGGAGIFRTPKPNIVDDIYSGIDLGQMSFLEPWVAWQWESFYAGYSIEHMLLRNGMDERADHCHCWPVSSDIAQANLLGYSLNVMPSLSCMMIDHRSWDNPQEPAPEGCGGEGLWRITDKQSLLREPEWVVPSPNNGWNLAAERRRNGL